MAWVILYAAAYSRWFKSKLGVDTCFTAPFYNECGSLEKAEIKPNPEWMAQVPDDTVLGHMTLPGTHDSGSVSKGLLDKWAETQVLSLKDQLEAGIRYLDIRLKKNEFNRLRMYHGPVDLDQNFLEALMHVGFFLANHPTETIVMRVQDVDCSRMKAECEATQDFSFLVDYEISTSVAKFFGNWGASTKLGETRGKVVMIQDFKGDKAAGAVPLEDFKMHDDWKVAVLPLDLNDAIAEKQKKTRDHMVAANADKDNFYVTHLSGNPAGAHSYAYGPKDVAYPVNEYAVDTMHGDLYKFGFGIVAMDFPGGDLIARAIKANPRGGVVVEDERSPEGPNDGPEGPNDGHEEEGGTPPFRRRSLLDRVLELETKMDRLELSSPML